MQWPLVRPRSMLPVLSTISEATQILGALSTGDRTRLDRLMELVYSELRGVARRYVSPRSQYEPMQATELVHAAFIKLVGHDGIDWRGRSHFYAVAATAMRQILVDEARKRLRDKRGSGQVNVSFDESLVLSPSSDQDVLAVDDVLSKLAERYPEQSRLVEMRFFGGMTMDEIAEATGVSKRTLHREWSMARAWLRRELRTD